MGLLNKVQRSQGCSVLVPFEQSHRVFLPLSKSVDIKQKRLNLLKK